MNTKNTVIKLYKMGWSIQNIAALKKMDWRPIEKIINSAGIMRKVGSGFKRHSQYK